MDRNRLKNLSGVEGLTNLSSISAGENRLVSIKGVENLTNLSSLEVNDNKLHSINGVENLTNLYSLNVLANKLEKLPDLKKLENLIYEKTSFLANHLSANEIAKNVPEKFRTYPSWLNKQIKFQNVKMMLKLIKPKTPKKITSKTRRITGKTDKRVTIVMKSGREEIRRKKANKKGIFTFKKLDFKKWRDKKVTIQAYFWVTYEYKYIIKTMAFRV